MMTLQSKANKNKHKSTINFPDGLLIIDKNKEKKPLSKAEQAWVDLIEYGDTSEILPAKRDNKIVHDKNKK